MRAPWRLLLWRVWCGFYRASIYLVTGPRLKQLPSCLLKAFLNGPDQQFLADGMTEALITNLGQASPIRVIARTSVNQYMKTRKPVQEIARELNVDVVVEGTIAQSGDRIRVTANLIQVSPERHIWAHSYERDFRDALTIENEIASAIAGEIEGKLTSQQQSRLGNARPVNPEVQLAYWKARYLLDHSIGDLEVYRKAIEYSEQAVRIDPNYAPAQCDARAGACRADQYKGPCQRGYAGRGSLCATGHRPGLGTCLRALHAGLCSACLPSRLGWSGARGEAGRRAESERCPRALDGIGLFGRGWTG